MQPDVQKRLERLREVEQEIQAHHKAIQDLEQELEQILDPSKKNTRRNVRGEKPATEYIVSVLSSQPDGLTKQVIYDGVCALAKYSVYYPTVNAAINKAVRDGILRKSEDGHIFSLASMPVQASLDVQPAAPSAT